MLEMAAAKRRDMKNSSRATPSLRFSYRRSSFTIEFRKDIDLLNILFKTLQ